MIKSVQFKNFKALRDTTLPLDRFTLIVGPNGSGKSSALQSLRLISNPGGLDILRSITAGERFSDDNFIEIILHLGWPYEGSTYRIRWLEGGSVHGPFYEGPLANMPQEARNRLLDQLGRIRVYSFDAQAIAAPVPLVPNVELQSNGNYLAGVLDQLRDQDHERFESLNEALGQWLPEFDRILFETPQSGTRSFLLRMRKGHHKIAAADLSQGTLLALAMLTLAYLPNPPSVICLEEPDRGIHPRLLRDVQDALYRLSFPESYGEEREPVQVITTTHSPYLLDLYRDYSEQVVIANKTEEGTKFERLSDQPYIEEILRDSHLGDVWYTGVLGGVPAQL